MIYTGYKISYHSTASTLPQAACVVLVKLMLPAAVVKQMCSVIVVYYIQILKMLLMLMPHALPMATRCASSRYSASFTDTFILAINF